MRVLYLIDSLAPGGAERSLAALAPCLIRGGVNLDVACLKDTPGLQDAILAAGGRVFCLAGPGGRAGRLRRALRLVRDLRPDLIHTTLADANLVGRAAGRFSRIPVVTSLVNVQYGPEHESDPNVLVWRLRLLRSLNAATAGWVTRFHAVTNEVAEAMSRRLRISPGLIDVIPRGRDPRVLGSRDDRRRTRARKRLGVAPAEKVILAAARQEHSKRLELLLEALPHIRREVPDARIVFAGRKGSATPLLQTTCERLAIGDRVAFLGPRDDVPDLLCAADVVALPSRREGFPGILIEAMALEAPIVVTDLPGIREMVSEDHALLVKGSHPQDFATAIVDALHDSKLTSRRTREARTRFLREFTIESIVERMLKFYGRALS